MELKHKHRILPGHVGGTYDPSNVVELTVEEHAEAHRLLFEEYGRWQDELAWKTLSGRITKEEAIRLITSKTHKGKKLSEEHKAILRECNLGKIPWNKGKQGIKSGMEGKKHSPESIERMRQAKLGKKMSNETKAKMRVKALGNTRGTKAFLGRKHTEQTKAKMNISAKNRSKT